MRKLSDILSQRIEKQVPSEDAPLMAFTAEGGVEPKGERYDRSYLVKSEDKLYKRTEYNDFIYSSNNLDVGSIGLNKYGTAVISDVYEIFSVKSDCLPTFVSELIQRPQNLAKILKYRQGCLYGQYRIYAEDFLSVSVFVPAKQEQNEIAQFLDSIDKRIAHQRSLIEALKKYKRGLQNRFFFKHSQLSPKDSEIDSRDVKPLGSVVHINPKTGSLPEAFIYIDLECVESGILNRKKLISRNSAPSRAQRLLEEGDLLYQMVRPYQKNNYYFKKGFEYPTVASTGYAQIRCSEMDTQFIYEQLSSDYFAHEAMLRSTGTGYPAINADDLAEIPIWVPPLDQQEKIGAALSFLGAKIEVHQKLLSALCCVKSSLLQQLFI